MNDNKAELVGELLKGYERPEDILGDNVTGNLPRV